MSWKTLSILYVICFMLSLFGFSQDVDMTVPAVISGVGTIGSIVAYFVFERR